ncbi:MAG: ribonuclease HII [Chloroflexota bacterium]|nr:ribonuclease HII [Chloroflexota bacterium]
MADLFWERACWKDGYSCVAGIDEAGRGALAGPIVAAAVILKPGTRLAKRLSEIDDSKRLPADVRNRLATYIRATALAWSVAEVSAAEIDTVGMARANRLCIERTIERLGTAAEILLIDALTCEAELPQIGLIDGDALSTSIAAASILAKTARDELMHQLHSEFTQYGFDRHVGYGTAYHLDALRQHGPCSHHRLSFAGVQPSEPA